MAIIMHTESKIRLAAPERPLVLVTKCLTAVHQEQNASKDLYTVDLFLINISTHKTSGILKKQKNNT